jgi:hypothetical protein
MASSRPVIISTKVGCGEDLLSSELDGWKVNPFQIENLIQILVSLTKEDLKAKGTHVVSKINQWSFQQIVTVLEENLVYGDY